MKGKTTKGTLEFKDDLIPRPLWTRLRDRLVRGPNGRLMVDDRSRPTRLQEFRGVMIGVGWGIIISVVLWWAIF